MLEFVAKAIEAGRSMESIVEELAFMQWLQDECRYLNVRPLGDGRWAGIQELYAHVAIMGGRIGDRSGINLRYCYHGPAGVSDTKQNAYKRALEALDAWDPATEPDPSGWHRDPHTGRRRPGGDPAAEYVEM
jgi:hypothetical protein